MVQLRELQLTELGILKDFAEVCKNMNLTYFLNSGTLLGAIRHGGFIPWDDDVDIAMPFEDYDKFLTIGQEQLGDRYFIQNMETDPNFNMSYTRVRLNGTTCMDSYKASWDIHHGVWIDVFPIVPLRGKLDFKLSHLVFSLCNYLQLDQSLSYYYDEYYNILGRLGITCLKFLYRLPMDKRIRLHKRIVWGMCRKKGKCCSVLWGNITTFYPENVFHEKTEVYFEGIKLCAPKEFDKYLTYTYGDYMQLPPEEKRKTHTLDTIDLENDYHKYLKL